MFKNALVSVSDKTNLAEFLKPLVQRGLRVVSTGGTSKYLKENGIAVVEVAEQTGFPEVMDGRVRTLHPLIHMALLARKENSEDMDLLKKYSLEPFDLVIGNLYPFSKYKEESIDERELSEYIDIGGPALLRAAAKNYHQTTVICDPQDYNLISEQKEVTLSLRKMLSAKLFSHISSYDAMVAEKLNEGTDSFEQEIFNFTGKKIKELRYGENPQQKALWIADASNAGLKSAQILHGKELSYNNILDLDAALDLAVMFDKPVCVAVKHNNPCGVATDVLLQKAVEKALKADPTSVFGGIIALNGAVDLKTAELLGAIFLECIVAPDYTSEALGYLMQKKNVRILKYDLKKHLKTSQLRSISGGYLYQGIDAVDLNWSQNWVVKGKKPSQKLLEDLEFSWKVCASLKSNAIAICEGQTTLGLGMGQVSRIDSVHQAIERMKKYHPNYKEPVLASDAFFPFEDSVELAKKNGIEWIIQPGGSVRDPEILKKAEELGVNIILTGKRHFKH